MFLFSPKGCAGGQTEKEGCEKCLREGKNKEETHLSATGLR